MLRDNNISLLTLPAHSSHFLQPLDVCPFGIFKKKLHNSVVLDAKDNMLLRRRKLAQSVYTAWCYARIPQNIRAGFERTGTWPINRDRILNPNSASTIKKESDQTMTSRRKRLSINNRILTSEKKQSVKSKRGPHSRENKVLRGGKKEKQSNITFRYLSEETTKMVF